MHCPLVLRSHPNHNPRLAVEKSAIRRLKVVKIKAFLSLRLLFMMPIVW